MKAKYLLHEFFMGDVEDPEIYCAQPIYEWQQTSAGKFCMEKGEDIRYDIMQDVQAFGYRIRISGILSDKHATFLALKRT